MKYGKQRQVGTGKRRGLEIQPSRTDPPVSTQQLTFLQTKNLLSSRNIGFVKI
jgi:hypothetical protein